MTRRMDVTQPPPAPIFPDLAIRKRAEAAPRGFKPPPDTHGAIRSRDSKWHPIQRQDCFWEACWGGDPTTISALTSHSRRSFSLLDTPLVIDTSRQWIMTHRDHVNEQRTLSITCAGKTWPNFSMRRTLLTWDQSTNHRSAHHPPLCPWGEHCTCSRPRLLPFPPLLSRTAPS